MFQHPATTPAPVLLLAHYMNEQFTQSAELHKESRNLEEISQDETPKKSGGISIETDEDRENKIAEIKNQINEMALSKESQVNKENHVAAGVDFVFEQNPELTSVGTPEQYSEYLETIFPESKIKDVVYHQTSSKEFDVADWKLSRLGGAYFSFYNSETLEPQWKKTMAKYIFGLGKESRTIIAVIDARNPFVINKENSKEIERKIGLSTQDISKLRKNFDLSDNDSMLGFANPRFDKGELNDLANHAIPNNKRSGIEIALFEPSKQVHILGSKQDIERFREFVNE